MSCELPYEALQNRVNELEKEIATLRRTLDRSKEVQSRYKKVEAMALLGHWELDIQTGALLWSDEIFRIFDLSPERFTATYEAFLERVHPDDRDFVDKSYSESIERMAGYDLVHRLLLDHGKVKFVHERCKTEYNDDGTPLRSLGTVQDITDRMRNRESCCGMIGRTPAMHEVFENIADLAEVDAPVLIQGESGTGKELVAGAIHRKSVRGDKPFVPINCGALPEGVLESELFGHVRGAFTGAVRDKKGRFELADGGTLLLDEVADLPKSVQVKLLRVLQEGTFERVGGEESIKVDVRVISAANRDLKEEVAAGNFREDLYYRIKVVPIHLPPLRERRGDIPLLAQYFVEKAGRDGYRTSGIRDDAVAALMDYDWPGNVRELQSAVQFALIKAKGGFIHPEHLPTEVRGNRPQERRLSVSPFLPSLVGKARDTKLDIIGVKEALASCDGNKLQAAKQLGVGRATLYRFLKDNPL